MVDANQGLFQQSNIGYASNEKSHADRYISRAYSNKSLLNNKVESNKENIMDQPNGH